MKFSIKDLFGQCDPFTEEILNRKLHFLCSAICKTFRKSYVYLLQSYCNQVPYKTKIWIQSDCYHKF